MFDNVIRVLLVLMLLFCRALMLLIQWLKEVIKNEQT